MILEKFKLTGKVAIVTGASRGLGQAMAIGFAEAGADIVGVATKDMLATEEAVKKIGRKFLPIQANLLTQEPIERIINDTINFYGKINILVNNAGVIRRNDAVDFTEKDWDDVMNVNLKSLFFLSQEVAKQMIKQNEGGKIINIGSLLSFQGGIRIPSYTASKSGVLGLTKLMANELAKYNINVNGIAPGYMSTDNTEPLRNDPVRSKELLGRIPAGRWGLPEELAGAAVFLASEAANYVNGTMVTVDGGWMSR